MPRRFQCEPLGEIATVALRAALCLAKQPLLLPLRLGLLAVPMARYLTHYSGWNKSWDEWLFDDRLLKYNDDGLGLQEKLKLARCACRWPPPRKRFTTRSLHAASRAHIGPDAHWLPARRRPRARRARTSTRHSQRDRGRRCRRAKAHSSGHKPICVGL